MSFSKTPQTIHCSIHERNTFKEYLNEIQALYVPKSAFPKCVPQGHCIYKMALVCGGKWFHDETYHFTKLKYFLQDFCKLFISMNFQEGKEDTAFPKVT